jgi:hypothetical protein
MFSHSLKNILQTFTYFCTPIPHVRKSISALTLSIFIFHIFGIGVFAGPADEFVSYAQFLQKNGMFQFSASRDLLHPVSQSELVKIAINING